MRFVLVVSFPLLCCLEAIGTSASLHHKRLFGAGKGFQPGSPPANEPFPRHLDNLNRFLESISPTITATRHRYADDLLRQRPRLAQSIREEMLDFGTQLPLIRVSRPWFPFSNQVLAFPLRQPHGQGGPGTTLAIVDRNRKGAFKLTDLSHMQGVHPDAFADGLTLMAKEANSQVTTLGKLSGKLDVDFVPQHIARL